MASAGFSVRILLLDGEVDGVQFLEVANWTGLGIVVPRERYNGMRGEAELSRTGVYVLTGPDPQREGNIRAYVGRAENLHARLDAHAKDKDWWDTCTCFTTSDNSLTLTHIQFLEAALIARAKQSGQANLDNTQCPDVPRLGRADAEDLGRFLENVLLLSGMAGLALFEVVDSAPTSQPEEGPTETAWRFAEIPFQYGGTGPYSATATYEARKRFVVHAGSEARRGETPSCPFGARVLRAKLLTDGILVPDGKHLRFTADHVFKSPSLAAAVVYGGAANGRTAWQDPHGRTINDLDEAEIEEQGLVPQDLERPPSEQALDAVVEVTLDQPR